MAYHIRVMTTLTIQLPEKNLAKLKEKAARLNLSVEQLASVGVDDLLSLPDEAFERVVEHILKKNAELYRRLA